MVVPASFKWSPRGEMNPARREFIEEVSVTKKELGFFTARAFHVMVLTLAIMIVGKSNTQMFASDCVQLSENAAKRVDAVLQKRLESRDNPHTSPAAKELGMLLFELRSSNEPVSDESLCALLNYYLGEANDGDVAYQVTARGQRLTPQLKAFRESPPCTAPVFTPLLHDEETRKMVLDIVVGAIEKGETVGAE